MCWQTGKMIKDLKVHLCKGCAHYTQFTLFADFFPHRYQALFSLHINDVPPSQNASLHSCSKPVSGVLFWVVFPWDHCIFSFVFSLSWSFSVYSQSHKAVRISDSPRLRNCIWQPSLYIKQNGKNTLRVRACYDFLMCSLACKWINRSLFAAWICCKNDLHLVVPCKHTLKLLQS